MMSDPIITRSVSSELYRKVTIDCDHVDSYHHETVYEEVEPDATLRWCFAHRSKQALWIGVHSCRYQKLSATPCEIGTALIVRTEG